MFDQLLGAYFVRDGQVTLRKAALNDRLEAFKFVDMPIAPVLGPATATAMPAVMMPNLRRVITIAAVVSRSGTPCGRVSESACIF